METQRKPILEGIELYLNRNTMYIDAIAEKELLVEMILSELKWREVGEYEGGYEVGLANAD